MQIKFYSFMALAAGTVSLGLLTGACGESNPQRITSGETSSSQPTPDSASPEVLVDSVIPVEVDVASPADEDIANPPSPDAGVPSDDAAASVCTGPTASRIAEATPYTAVSPAPTEVGAVPPPIALKDVQPLSCGFEKTYGLAPFANKATLVTLLSAGCGFCQNQAAKLEELVLELGLRGIETHVVIINLDSQAETVRLLTERTTLPILQDTTEAAAWTAFAGRKDDIFVYDTNHRLSAFFRTGQDPELNMGTETGYANVKNALLAAAGQK